MKKGLLYALVGVIIIVIIGLIIYVFKDNDLFVTNDSIYIGVFDNSLEKGDNYVFTNYTDYVSTLNTTVLTEESFSYNNYVLVEVPYDSCSDSNLKLASYTIDGNNIDVKITYKQGCGVCAPLYNYYLIRVDKNLREVNVNIEYKPTNKAHCDNNVAYKPIIYLYPEEETKVSVRLLNEKYLTTTYPKYNSSWEVTAYPDGKLIDNKTNRELYSLYWEGENYQTSIQEEGFVVKGEDTISFLEEKLNILGLTEREADEFIIYWLPKLEKNKYNYIRFENEEDINNYMPLSVSPNPDTIIRVLMAYKPLDKKIKVRDQELTTPIREGFTLVEWGGTLIK